MAARGRSAVPIVIAMASLLALASGGLCPARCHCDDEALRASCAQAGLEVVPIQLNPDIRQLDLARNRVSTLHLAFVFYGNLESLDLSSNSIRTLGSENFDLQNNLKVLNASSNDITAIAKFALRGLRTLRILDLSDNNITEIDSQAFRDTSELEFLNLSENSIISLPDGLLENLHRIRQIRLSRNSILEIPRTNLVLAPSLEDFDLSYNLVEELNEDSFPPLSSLVTLNLSNNVIRSISDRSFDGLPSLLSLDLSGNNLTVIPTPALARLNVLSSLVLNRNPLESLEAVAFRNLFELKNLELEDCRISSIHGRSFADNVNLERVSLDGNRELQDLPPRVLFGAMYLKSVSLKRCSLSRLQPTDFPVDGLSYLGLGGNPLVCNCSLHWLWNVLRAAQRRNETRLELDSEEIVCSDEEFAGKPLLDLPESSLRCRLSPLYLSLSAAGCLVVTATILALIAYLTRAKRRKRLAYAAPNRPEFLVYVGRSNDDLSKDSAESYSRRLLRNDEDGDFRVNEADKRLKDSERRPKDCDRRLKDLDRTNVYESPRPFKSPGLSETRSYETEEFYTRPGNIHGPCAHQDESKGLYPRREESKGLHARRDAPKGLYTRRDDQTESYPRQDSPKGLYLRQDESKELYPIQNEPEGLYAVADVTDLPGNRSHPPEVLSLYRMQNPSPGHSVRRYDYDYDHDYEAPINTGRPHVVFV